LSKNIDGIMDEMERQFHLIHDTINVFWQYPKL
jgi:hypothetical protein